MKRVSSAMCDLRGRKQTTAHRWTRSGISAAKAGFSKWCRQFRRIGIPLQTMSTSSKKESAASLGTERNQLEEDQIAKAIVSINVMAELAKGGFGSANDDHFDVNQIAEENLRKVKVNRGRKRAEAYLTQARQDAVLVHARGLFRSIGKCAREVEELEIPYKGKGKSKGMSVQFVCREPLGADDLTVLLGLNALAAALRELLKPNSESPTDRELRRRLELKFDAEDADTLVVRSSFRELAREVGYGDSRNMQPIQRSIERLSSVTIHTEAKGKQESSRLLADCSSSCKSGGLVVALNPRISRAILGERGTQYIKYYMDEVRALKNPISKLIYYYLCGVVNLGYKQIVSMDKIMSYAWPMSSNVASTEKSRRYAIKEALEDLCNFIGWRVERLSGNRYSIARPKKLQFQ